MFDVLLALVAACAAIPFAIHERHHHPSVGTAMLLVLAAVPLVARRTWPITVFGLLLDWTPRAAAPTVE